MQTSYSNLLGSIKNYELIYETIMDAKRSVEVTIDNRQDISEKLFGKDVTGKMRRIYSRTLKRIEYLHCAQLSSFCMHISKVITKNGYDARDFQLNNITTSDKLINYIKQNEYIKILEVKENYGFDSSHGRGRLTYSFLILDFNKMVKRFQDIRYKELGIDDDVVKRY